MSVIVLTQRCWVKLLCEHILYTNCFHIWYVDFNVHIHTIKAPLFPNYGVHVCVCACVRVCMCAWCVCVRMDLSL